MLSDKPELKSVRAQQRLELTSRENIPCCAEIQAWLGKCKTPIPAPSELEGGNGSTGPGSRLLPSEAGQQGHILMWVPAA